MRIQVLFPLSLLALSIVVSAEKVQVHSPVLGIGEGIMSSYNKRPVSRVLRQTDRESARQCSRVVYRTQCTSTEYAQNFIDTISKCETYGRTTAIAAELLCRQNSNGDYCGSAGIDISSVLEVLNVCSSSCSSSCRSALIALKNQQGCCLTSSPVFATSRLSVYFGYCGLSNPSACPATSLTLPSSSQTDSSCGSIENFLRTTSKFTCTSQNIQPTLDALRKNNCDEFAKLNEFGCSFRNGQYCYEHFLSVDALSVLIDATSACPTTFSCSSSCQRSLKDLNNQLGCCLNLYNSSLQAYESFTSTDISTYSTITNYNLWRECRITTPGICEVRLANGGFSLLHFSVIKNLIMLFCTSFSLMSFVIV